MKGHCVQSLKTLLSCGINDLHDDGFECSMNEHQIFREVFFGHESGKTDGMSKMYDVTGVVAFENDKKTPKDISLCSDSGSSVMTNQEDFQNLKESSEEPALFTRNSPFIKYKRRKILPVEQLEHLETKSHPEMVVSSSVSSKVVSSNSNDQKTDDTVQTSKKRWKDSSFIQLDKDELLIPPEDSATNPKPILRYYTFHLLKAAGWLIGRRNRKQGGEYVYKTPEGRPIREFHRSWNMCGQRLVKDAKYVGVCNGTVWTSLTDFRSDLSNAVTEVEKLRNLGTKTALAHWWYLLDPFAKMVFIDRSLPLLKQGKEVKAKRSEVKAKRSPVNCSRSLKSKKHQKAKKVNCHLKDDDLLFSAVLTNRSTNKRLGVKRKYKSKRGGCRLLPSSSADRSGLTVRTVLSRLIDLGAIHVNEVIQYRNPQDDSVVKHGVVTRNGISCRCCKKLLSFSNFKNHAGQPQSSCLNLYMESGKSFTLCQLEAWSAEYKVRQSTKGVVQVYKTDKSDDSCGLCGDGGELICCDNCLSTFHQACLSTQELPEGSWYCAMCCCNKCGDVVDNDLKCLQCERKYHDECIKENRIMKDSVGPTWFCGETCQKIHSSLDSQIGSVNLLSDGYSWTLLRCSQSDQKVHSGQHFVALEAECNLKLAVALTIMEECFLPMVDTRTGIHMLPHVLYNQGSEYVRLNYEGFYTMVLEKDDILLCVASLRIHGARVAEMPLIATFSKYRRQGMCRRLMNAIEEMLKSFKVEMLVVSAIPSLVDTWTHGFGFTPLEADEKKSFDKTNLMVFPGTVWLKKPMYQESIQNTYFPETVYSDNNGDLVDTVPVYDMEFLQELENVIMRW
ncbi:increased DNA methylation 1-like isoform X2 [Bidens hawaiensis]|uniref:increased DNA methylation 1-like isoform X2 n=1 Tax=Bidens hawaiensis TaxID=980011 RepID=UPI00404A817C